MATRGAEGKRGASVAVNALFVVGLGLLWSAGFADAPVRAVSAGHVRVLALLAPGVTVAVLGLVCGIGRRKPSLLALLQTAACVVAFHAAALSWGAGASGLAAVLDGLLDGLLFFMAISLTLRHRAVIVDGAVPLAFFAGSALACASSVWGVAVPHVAALDGAFIAFLLCFWGLAHSEGGDLPMGKREEWWRPVARRWALLRYGALAAGAMAVAFVFGVMTDLHGWMASADETAPVQISNMVASALLAVVFTVCRRPFRVDGALAVVLPLFAAALLSLPAEPAGLSISRLAIMVGYLLLFVIAWVLVKREQRPFSQCGVAVLAFTVGLLLAFAQVGRFVAAGILGTGGMTSETLSAVALGFFWLMALVAAGAYWLARTRAVERDLSALEVDETAGVMTGESGNLARTDSPADGDAAAEDSAASALVNDGGSGNSGVVYVDTVALQAERLAAQIGLSARELEVLEEFARGRSAASIAEKFFISPNTVKTHLRRIYEKAGIHSRRELLDMMDEA